MRGLLRSEVGAGWESSIRVCRLRARNRVSTRRSISARREGLVAERQTIMRPGSPKSLQIESFSFGPPEVSQKAASLLPQRGAISKEHRDLGLIAISA